MTQVRQQQLRHRVTVALRFKVQRTHVGNKAIRNLPRFQLLSFHHTPPSSATNEKQARYDAASQRGRITWPGAPEG